MTNSSMAPGMQTIDHYKFASYLAAAVPGREDPHYIVRDYS